MKRDYSLDSVSYDAWSVREPVVAAMKSAALTWVRAAPPPSLAASHRLVSTSCQLVSTLPPLNVLSTRLFPEHAASTDPLVQVVSNIGPGDVWRSQCPSLLNDQVMGG